MGGHWNWISVVAGDRSIHFRHTGMALDTPFANQGLCETGYLSSQEKK
jgi:hypothetical protein